MQRVIWAFSLLVCHLGIAYSQSGSTADQTSGPGSRTIHVDGTQPESGDGSEEAPFRTIQRAADEACAGDTVRVAAGTYRETIIVRADGTAEAPIVFQGDGEVILAGGDPVIGWERHGGDVWSAPAPIGAASSSALFVAGELQFEARYCAENDPLDLGAWGRVERDGVKSASVTAESLRGFGDGHWVGAKIRFHTHDWVIRTEPIAAYDSRAGRVSFEEPVGTVSQKHRFGYYLFGSMNCMDRPGEWLLGEDNRTLFFQAEPGGDLAAAPPDIELGVREHAFDLSGAEHVVLRGFTMRGAAVRTDRGTRFCRIEGSRLFGYGKGGKGRFFLNGEGNELSANEISQTFGGALSISGRGHRIVNNLIHDIGYSGTARVFHMGGDGHLVARNTVRRFCRSFLDGYPERSEFCHNVFEDGARLSWDTGVFDGDSQRGNGGRCIVHHNIFRNIDSVGIYCAFYAGLDLVVHHNLVHDLAPTTLRSGQQEFLKYYHNTWVGSPPRGDVHAGAYAHGSSYCNNVQVSDRWVASLGVEHQGNYDYVEADFVDFAGKDFRLAEGSSAINSGAVLPGINDGWSGVAPDPGAFECGQTPWTAGHDFDDPVPCHYAWTPLPGTNLFGNGQFRRKPTGWESVAPQGGGLQRVDWHFGNAWNTLQEGLSRVGGYGLRVAPGKVLIRVFDGLKPDTLYRLGVEVRLTNQLLELEEYLHSSSTGKSPGLLDGKHRGENFVTGLGGGDWLMYAPVDFGDADPLGEELVPSDVGDGLGLAMYSELELVYSFPALLATGEEVPSVEVRLDRPDGALLGRFGLHPSVADSWGTSHLPLSKAIFGERPIYLVARGRRSPEIRLSAIRFQREHVVDGLRARVAVGNGATGSSMEVGRARWGKRFEETSFRTGQRSSSVEVAIYGAAYLDAYVDRLCVYEILDKGPKPLLERTGPIGEEERDLVRSDGTVTEGEAWWEVEFPQVVNIGEVAMGSGYPELEGAAQLSVLDGPASGGGRVLWRGVTSFPCIGATKGIVTGDAMDEQRNVRLASVQGRVLRIERIPAEGQGAAGVPGDIRVQVYSCADRPPLTNVARQGLASQSSDYYAKKGHADVACNGVTVPLADFTSTRREPGAWWQVELERGIAIDQIVLFNRAESAQRIGRFRVTVWDRDPGGGGDPLWACDYSYRNGDLPAAGALFVPGAEGSRGKTLRSHGDARFVRIELLDAEMLSLAEVQVWQAP